MMQCRSCHLLWYQERMHLTRDNVCVQAGFLRIGRCAAKGRLQGFIVVLYCTHEFSICTAGTPFFPHATHSFPADSLV